MNKACPQCGCSRSRVSNTSVIEWRKLGEEQYRQTLCESRECAHCGKHWQETEELEAGEAVVRPTYLKPLACPHCGCGRTIVTSSRPECRYRKCQRCKRNFKSYESVVPA